MTDEKKSPAWGYHKKHGAKLFEDGNLPAGYADVPHPGQHPHDAENGITATDEKRHEPGEDI